MSYIAHYIRKTHGREEMGDFDRCNAKTRQWEGGDVNDPRDPGGLTSRGVTQSAGAEYRRRHGLAPKVVTAWSDAEVTSFYREQYWTPVRGEALPSGVDLSVYDFGVHSGPSRSVKKLQVVLGGLAVDGIVGPKTLAAIGEARKVDLIKAHCAARLGFLEALAVWNTFGKGFSRRVADIQATALVWAGASASDLKEEARKTESKAAAGASGAVVAGGTVPAAPQSDLIAAWAFYGAGAVLVFALVVWAIVQWQRAQALRAAAQGVSK